MLREGGWGSGYGVRFVGHAEHADIVDLVAEHHYTGFRQVLHAEHMGHTLVLCGAGVVDCQDVPVPVFLLAVYSDRSAVTQSYRLLQMLDPRQRIDGGEADYLILKAVVQVLEVRETRIVVPLSITPA